MRSLTLISAFSFMVVLASGALAGNAAEKKPAAPPRCDQPEHRQFDFWIGAWSVESPDGENLGRNRITLELDECVLHERWEGARGRKGESFNMFDRRTGRWHQTWVSDIGMLLLLDGGREGASMRLEGSSARPDGTAVLDRITWTPIDRDGCRGCVRQLWEQSDDGGASWFTVFEGLYRPAAAR